MYCYYLSRFYYLHMGFLSMDDVVNIFLTMGTNPMFNSDSFSFVRIRKIQFARFFFAVWAFLRIRTIISDVFKNINFIQKITNKSNASWQRCFFKKSNQNIFHIVPCGCFYCTLSIIGDDLTKSKGGLDVWI